MTVHMFRVFVGRGKMSISDLETRINDWVDSNPEWTEDSVEHTLSERIADNGSGTTFHAIDVRFRKEDTKSNLVQKLKDKLKNKVDWYRLGYHSCPHDGAVRDETEQHALEPGIEVQLEYAIKPGTVSIGSGGYEAGIDYEVAGATLTIPEDSSIVAGSYSVEYGTSQCDWDDQAEWTAKDTSIPPDIPSV